MLDLTIRIVKRNWLKSDVGKRGVRREAHFWNLIFLTSAFHGSRWDKIRQRDRLKQLRVTIMRQNRYENQARNVKQRYENFKNDMLVALLQRSEAQSTHG